MSNRAQAVTFDLAIALFVFIILFIAISMLWSSNLQNFQTQQEYDYIQTQTFLLSELLVKTKGAPENWHTLPLEDITTIGLASKDRVLDAEKVSALENLFSSDYTNTKAKLKQPVYEIFIQLDSSATTTTDVNLGLPPAGNVIMVTIRRIVDYNESEAVFDVTIYKNI